jgi:hypothetical protein
MALLLEDAAKVDGASNEAALVVPWRDRDCLGKRLVESKSCDL